MKRNNIKSNKRCDICEILFHDAQSLKNHLTRETHFKNQRKANEMAAKATKITRRSITEGFVGDVTTNFYDDGISKQTLFRVTRNARELNPDNLHQTIEDLNDFLSDMRSVLEPLAETVREDTLDASDEEKGFYRSLPHKITGVPESMSSSGVPIAGTPTDYQNSVAALELMEVAMLKRVNAIRYEIKRREMEPAYDVTEWLLDSFTPARIQLNKSYTQEH
jgi:hypothetical protein